MGGEIMQFPKTVDEFMEQYKVVDTEHIYSNGTEYVPIFRMKQWFEYQEAKAKKFIEAYAKAREILAFTGEFQDPMPEPKIEIPIYDIEEIHHGCTVQVLTSSVTGESSVGWWKEEE